MKFKCPKCEEITSIRIKTIEALEKRIDELEKELAALKFRNASGKSECDSASDLFNSLFGNRK